MRDPPRQTLLPSRSAALVIAASTGPGPPGRGQVGATDPSRQLLPTYRSGSSYTTSSSTTRPSRRPRPPTLRLRAPPAGRYHDATRQAESPHNRPRRQPGPRSGRRSASRRVAAPGAGRLGLQGSRPPGSRLRLQPQFQPTTGRRPCAGVDGRTGRLPSEDLYLGQRPGRHPISGRLVTRDPSCRCSPCPCPGGQVRGLVPPPVLRTSTPTWLSSLAIAGLPGRGHGFDGIGRRHRVDQGRADPGRTEACSSSTFSRRTAGHVQRLPVSHPVSALPDRDDQPEVTGPGSRGGSWPDLRRWIPNELWRSFPQSSGYRTPTAYPRRTSAACGPTSAACGRGPPGRWDDNKSTPYDYRNFVRACQRLEVFGGSIYDWRHDAAPSFDVLRGSDNRHGASGH